MTEQWRLIITDSEGLTGVAPVCPHQNDITKHSTGDGYLKNTDPHGVYDDCCPWPQLEAGNERDARRICDLLNAGASSEGLARQIAELESQLAEAQRELRVLRNSESLAEVELERHKTLLDAQIIHRRRIVGELRQCGYVARTLHRELSDHIANLGDKQPWDNRAMFDRALALVTPLVSVGAHDAVVDEGNTARSWAVNNVYTVSCPTCGRVASAYCVNAQGREVYPAHAARYQRLAEFVGAPIAGPQAGGEG